MLQTGAFAWLETEAELIAFRRCDADGAIEVYINSSDMPLTISNQSAERLFSLGRCTEHNDVLVLHPYAALVLKVEGRTILFAGKRLL